MTEHHPSPRELEEFVLGRLPKGEMRKVSRHLLAGCEECGRATSSLWSHEAEPFEVADRPAPKALPSPTPDAYDQVLDRVFARVVAREKAIEQERAEAVHLFAELIRHPPARRELLVRNSVRFRRRMLAEKLVDESHRAGFSVPAQSVDLARLAVLVAEAVGATGELGAEACNSLAAKTWTQLGNALRVAGDLSGADREIARALERLDAPGGSTMLDRATVFYRLAALRKEQRRFEEALELLDRVGAIYRRLGQRSLLARTLRKKAMVLGEAGEPEAEIALYHRALELIDQQEEPWDFLVARHNLICALSDTGRYREAFALLFHTRPLYLKHGTPLTLVHMRWLEGAIALGLGRLDQAEAAFCEVRSKYLERSMDFDAALASLNLAEVYARRGRAGEVRALAEEVLAVFAERQIHRESFAALSMLAEAARVESVQASLVREVSDLVKRSRGLQD
jgi:tetratricopeptide (TPR) repeat protein